MKSPPLTKSQLYARLDEALANPEDVYVGHVEDAAAYLAQGKTSLLSSRVEPQWVVVNVTDQGRAAGIEAEKIEGYLLAAANGYWLLYLPQEDVFHMAWGHTVEQLGAHGFFGKDPLAIWLD